MSNSRNKLLDVVHCRVLVVLAIYLLAACSSDMSNASLSKLANQGKTPLRVVISPYQDLAMLVNAKNLGLEQKHGTKLELLTMPWEDILPAIASAGQTADVGFGSLFDYLIKLDQLNKQNDDPVLYIYPAYVFKGGGFITFNPAVPEINRQTINNPALVKKFLSFKIGAQKNSGWEMLLFMLAKRAGMRLSDLHLIDTTMNDGFMAAKNGSLDIAAAGLTQRTEALKCHGWLVLTMDTLNIGDLSGFICKESVYKKKKKEIDSLVKMWFECVNYVLSDLDHHSAVTLAYLKDKASTQYTLDEFKRALTHEYFPMTLEEAEKELVSSSGKYAIAKETSIVSQYLMEIGVAKKPRQAPKVINVGQYHSQDNNGKI